MRGRRLIAGLVGLGAGVLVLLAGCGAPALTTSKSARLVTPSSSVRAAVLQVVDTAFFSATGAPPDLRIAALEEVTEGSAAWVRATFAAAAKAPERTRQGLADNPDQGLLWRTLGSGWTWLGYVAPEGVSCRTTARAAPPGVVRLLRLPPVCASSPTPSTSPSAPPTGGAAPVSLSGGDLATMLSIFVSAKNAGTAGQVLTPSSLAVSTSAPPRAARAPGGTEWAVVSYVPASGAPEPLTGAQLQDGAGTAFFAKAPGGGWTLRGLAGSPLCSGATAARVPAGVLTLWGYSC